MRVDIDSDSSGRSGAAAIRQWVRPPSFAERWFPITDFGATGDGHTDDSAAIRQAITECHRSGGGHVTVPTGTFHTGPIRLLDGVDLNLAEGAVLAFHRDPLAYLPVVHTRWEGVELMNYHPFVYAFGARDIAVTGRGVLDGRADESHWWDWKPLERADSTQLGHLVEQGTPVADRVFGEGYHLPPSFIQPYRCENVLIQGVTLHNSPFWQIHPVLCRNVTVDSVTARSHGPNNDGCNPESCDGVSITGCTFDTGDDCIAIKSGRNTDGRRLAVPCQHILIENCSFAAGHGGVTIGSEMSGGVRHVYGSNLRMDSPDLWSCARFKTNSVRGGCIRDVHLDGVRVGRVRDQMLEIDYLYEEGDAGDHPPTVDGIHLSDWRVGLAGAPWRLIGYPHAPIGTVSLTGVTIDRARRPGVVRDVADLRLVDVTVNGEPATTGPSRDR